VYSRIINYRKIRFRSDVAFDILRICHFVNEKSDGKKIKGLKACHLGAGKCSNFSAAGGNNSGLKPRIVDFSCKKQKKNPSFSAKENPIPTFNIAGLSENICYIYYTICL